MQNSIKLIAGLLLALALIAGCGQKGPLFLPGTPTEIRSVPEQEQIEADRDDEEEERRQVIQYRQ